MPGMQHYMVGCLLGQLCVVNMPGSVHRAAAGLAVCARLPHGGGKRFTLYVRFSPLKSVSFTNGLI